MSDLQNIATAELEQLAREWRERALRGLREARGYAHEYEAEMRRRKGRTAGLATASGLDLRPIEERERSAAARAWWRFW
ncbi:hypothetical protein [Pseudorhodoferax soli]|nr:hypothetical protein [Pseudorhodoferax soli]